MRADSMATDLCRRVSGFTAPRAVAVQNLDTVLCNFALDIIFPLRTGVEAATIGLSVFRSLRSGGCLAPPPHI